MLGEAVESCQPLAALLDSTNAAQRQKRPVPKGWGGIGGIAALRRRGEPARAVRRQRALHYPQWRSHIRHRIYEFEYLARQITRIAVTIRHRSDRRCVMVTKPQLCDRIRNCGDVCQGTLGCLGRGPGNRSGLSFRPYFAIVIVLGLVHGQPLHSQPDLAPDITSPLEATGTVNTAFFYQITATNNPVNFVATGLPSGLALNAGNGTIIGTPTASGVFTIPLTAANGIDQGKADLILEIRERRPRIISSASATIEVNRPFSYRILATNSPSNFTATGLPSGMIIDTASGVISGIPVLSGNTSAQISAINPFGSGSATLEITVFGREPRIVSPNAVHAPISQSLQYTIAATNNPFQFGATGLPTGLFLNQATGVISGIPVTEGEVKAEITATNQFGSGRATLRLDLTQRAPLMVSPDRVAGQVGKPFSYQVIARNSPSQYQSSILPPGISINTASGLISGTPVVAGTFTIMLRLINNSGVGAAEVEVIVNSSSANPPVITSPSVVIAELSRPFTYRPAATDGVTQFSTTLLPEGVNVSDAGTDIIGTLEVVDTYFFSLLAENREGTGSKVIELRVVPEPESPPSIDSSLRVTPVLGQPMDCRFRAAGNAIRYDGDGLPVGMFIESSTGRVRGTPGQAGDFSVLLTASNAAGSDSANFVFRVAETPVSIFTDDPESAGGFRESDWFGSVNDANYPWVFHDPLGFLFVTSVCDDDIWMYSADGVTDLDLGWIWTSRAHYPFLYSVELDAWLLYEEGTRDPRLFFNYSSGETEQY